MKKRFLVIAFGLMTLSAAHAQYPEAYSSDIGYGYFDGAKFAQYDSIPTPPYYGGYSQVSGRFPIGGMLGLNPFVLSFGNPENIRSSSSDRTARGNWVPITNRANGVADMSTINGQDLNSDKAAQQIGLVWNGNYDGIGPTGPSTGTQTSYPLPAGCSFTYTFANNLEPLDQFLIADVDAGEEILIEFLDAAGNALDKEANMRIVHLTNDTAGATAPITSVNASTYGINIGPAISYYSNTANETYSFVVTSGNVKTVKITQIGYQNRGSGGWWVIPVKGAPDRGDAPVSYGDARIQPLAAKLRLGTRGGDTETVPHHSTDAAGDNIIANGNDYSGTSRPQPDYGRYADEDGLITLPPIANNGSLGQTITGYSVTGKATSKDAAYAIAWIDWDGNGRFDTDEARTATIPAGSTDVDLTFTWPKAILNGAVSRTGTYLRIIISSEPVSGSSQNILYPGFGEVEDYYLPFYQPLPVKLIKFDAYKEGSVATLKWATANEQNNEGFEIERSADGRNWTKIGFESSIGKNGDSDIRLDYDFIDSTPLNGQNFYRLKQVDFDNKFEYSLIRVVNFERQVTYVVFPNPSSKKISISGLQGNESIKIRDVDGKLWYQIKANRERVNISLGKLRTGVYYITIIDASGNVSTHRLVKY